MNYKYFFSYLLAITFLATSCNNAFSGPEKIVQFEIETQVAEYEKATVVKSVQNRLMSLGAKNVKIVDQESQKITFSYHGTIEREVLEKNISIAGNLEFYEVCQEKVILDDFLLNFDESNKDDTQETAEKDRGEVLLDRLSGIPLVIHKELTDIHDESALGFVYAGDVTYIKPLLEKSAIYIPKLKKKVKFLLGKSKTKNQRLVYAVYVTSSEKAPLNGRYIEYINAAEGYVEGRYQINIQMNPEGAQIWEQLTEKVFQTRGNIAVVLDGIVHVAPTVTNGKIVGGNTEISGSFTKEEAKMLASVIKSGTIPKMKILKMEVVK